jgi:hypothetical protein
MKRQSVKNADTKQTDKKQFPSVPVAKKQAVVVPPSNLEAAIAAAPGAPAAAPAAAPVAPAAAVAAPAPARLPAVPVIPQLVGFSEVELMGGPVPVEDILGGTGLDVVMVMVGQAKALQAGPALEEVSILTSDVHGELFLRRVAYADGGVLIGIVDSSGVSYGAAEWYSDQEAAAGWDDWLKTIQM